MSSERLRLAGARWRLLVHEWNGKRREYSVSHTVAPKPGVDSEHGRHHEVPPTEFDELVVSRWLHVEQMASGRWWMNIGGVTVHITADRDGRPQHVTVHGPDDYAGAVEGVAYELDWSVPSTQEKP